MDLSAVLADLKSEEVQVKTVDIDVSKWLGEGAKLTLKESDTASLFNSTKLVKRMQINNPTWPDTLCENVGLLGNCHIAPVIKDNPIVLYTQLALKRSECFLYILGEYNKAFSSNLGQAVDDAKNDSALSNAA